MKLQQELLKAKPLLVDLSIKRNLHHLQQLPSLFFKMMRVYKLEGKKSVFFVQFSLIDCSGWVKRVSQSVYSSNKLLNY